MTPSNNSNASRFIVAVLAASSLSSWSQAFVVLPSIKPRRSGSSTRLGAVLSPDGFGAAMDSLGGVLTMSAQDFYLDTSVAAEISSYESYSVPFSSPLPSSEPHSYFPLLLSHLLTVPPSALDMASDPVVESNVLGGLAHAMLDIPPFVQLNSRVMLKTTALVGRLIAITADYLPDHFMSEQEIIVQSILLIVALKDVWTTVWEHSNAGLSSNATKID